jgi:hypothetical protein
MRARIFALAGMIALAACSNDPTAVQVCSAMKLGPDKPIPAVGISSTTSTGSITQGSTCSTAVVGSDPMFERSGHAAVPGN